MDDILSIVAVCRNEEVVLQRFFDSVHTHFGKNVEVVIVDTGSKDRSVQIAKENGAKVIEAGDKFAFEYDITTTMYVNNSAGTPLVSPGDRVFLFDQARNEVTKYATKEWCISLDIVHVIENINLMKLQHLLRSTSDDVISIRELLGNTVLDTRRIYRRNSSAKWRYPVHELLTGRTSTTTDAVIVRRIRKQGDVKSYLPMLSYMYYLWKREEAGDDARAQYYFTRELYYHKHFVQARSLFEKLYSRTDNWIKERSQASCFWAETFTAENDPNWLNKRREGYLRAIRIFPGWREPYLKLCDICFNEEDWAGMVAYANQALTIPEQALPPLHIEPVNNYTTEPFRYKYLGTVRLAMCQKSCGMDPTKLIEEYLSMEQKTGCSEHVFVLGWELAYQIFLASGKDKKAKAYLNKLYRVDPTKWEEAYRKSEKK